MTTTNAQPVSFATAMEGKPFLWRTALYGDIAVHVKKMSPNGVVAVLTIDGGEASTPAQRYPVLSDGTGFAVQGQLFKRPTQRVRDASAEKALAEAAGVINRSGMPKMRLEQVEQLSIKELRAYTRQHYSSIAKLTRKADIVLAIRKIELASTEETF